jgi:arylsulfatase A-like enzyme
MKLIQLWIVCCIFSTCNTDTKPSIVSKAPNILFCIADDWGWPHAGVYGDSVVRTPTFDKLTKEGVLFEHAFVSSPSCTPSRNAILTGQHHWQLDEGANLWSTLNINHPVYPLLLEKEGYQVGFWRKSFGPGNLEPGGYIDCHPAGKEYPTGFKAFLDSKPNGKPFSFWLGASDPHRSYKLGSGVASGIDVDAIQVPAFLPDTEEVRSDLADYYFEVERFYRDCAEAIRLLEERGELENTIVVITGDHGMPFPRCKSNLYDMGVRVPLAIRWGDKIKPNRRITDFVSLVDLAPTFLEAAGVEIPPQMTGKSILSVLKTEEDDKIQPEREYAIFGRERHVTAQLMPSIEGYPSRGIRTKEYLYIYNFYPERWPAGVPENATHPMNSFADCDNGPSKSFLMENKDSEFFRSYYNLSFGKRPMEELYEIASDPDQLNNLASEPDYEQVRKMLHEKLMASLEDASDPRMTGEGKKFDVYPYLGPL